METRLSSLSTEPTFAPGDEVVFYDTRWQIGFLVARPVFQAESYYLKLETSPLKGSTLAKADVVTKKPLRPVLYHRGDPVAVDNKQCWIDDVGVSSVGDVLYQLRTRDSVYKEQVSEEELTRILTPKTESTEAVEDAAVTSRAQQATLTTATIVKQISRNESATKAVLEAVHRAVLGQSPVQEVQRTVQQLFDAFDPVWHYIFDHAIVELTTTRLISEAQKTLRRSLSLGLVQIRHSLHLLHEIERRIPASMCGAVAVKSILNGILLVEPQVAMGLARRYCPDQEIVWREVPRRVYHQMLIDSIVAAVRPSAPTSSVTAFELWRRVLESIEHSETLRQKAVVLFSQTKPSVLEELAWLATVYPSDGQKRVPGFIAVAIALGASVSYALGGRTFDQAMAPPPKKEKVTKTSIVKTPKTPAKKLENKVEAHQEVVARPVPPVAGFLEQLYPDGVFLEVRYVIQPEPGQWAVTFESGGIVAGLEPAEHVDVAVWGALTADAQEAARSALEQLYVYGRILETIALTEAAYVAVKGLLEQGIYNFRDRYGEKMLLKLPGFTVVLG